MSRPGLGSRRPVASEDLSFLTSIGGGPDRSAEIEQIPLDLVDDSELLCLRERPFPGISQLAAQIKKHGQTTPVFVRPKEDGRFELVSGYRRTAALRSIQAPTLLARIYRGLTDDEAYALAVSENADRDDLTSWERAKACHRLHQQGRSYLDIAAMFQWTDDRHVRNHIRLATEAPTPVAEALQQGALGASLALDLMRLASAPFSDDDAARITSLVIAKEMSVRATRAFLETEALRLTGASRPKNRSAQAPIRVKKLRAGGFQLSAKVTADLSSEDLAQVTTELKKLLKQVRALQSERQSDSEDSEP